MKEKTKKRKTEKRTVKIFTDFKNFAVKGNMVDLAVGIIIGSAFTSIVQSLVNDIVMPFIGLLLTDINFSELKITLSEAVYDNVTGEVVKAANYLSYGKFIQNIVTFLITAATIFLFVRILAKAKDALAAADTSAPVETEIKVAEAEPTLTLEFTKTEILLEEIRDLLRNGK